jgi:hypothetical protein
MRKSKKQDIIRALYDNLDFDIPAWEVLIESRTPPLTPDFYQAVPEWPHGKDVERLKFPESIKLIDLEQIADHKEYLIHGKKEDVDQYMIGMEKHFPFWPKPEAYVIKPSLYFEQYPLEDHFTSKRGHLMRQAKGKYLYRSE